MSSGIVEPSQGASSESQQSQQSGSSRSQLIQRLLSASSSLPAFMNDLLTAQAVVVAGSEAAGFLIHKQDEATNLQPVGHVRPDDSGPEQRSAALAAFAEILKPCVIQNKDGAVEIGEPDESGESRFCLATLLRADEQVVAVSAVIVRCRDTERARQRLMSMQLVAGYFDLFTLRRNSEQARIIAASHQHALQCVTSVAMAEGFESAAMGLCNELATRTGATRVALGWVKGTRIRIKALSHTEKFDKKQELIVSLEAVMEECWDQDQVVKYEPESVHGDAVTREAERFSRSQAGNTVLSIPLRTRQEIVGILTLEFSPGHRINEQAAQGLAVAADLLAPQLYDRWHNDRWLITKAGHSAKNMLKLAIGPTHMLAKTIVALVLVAAAVAAFYKPMYHVTAPFQFVPVEKRTLSAPFDGFLKDVLVEPGQSVKANQVLARMDTTELTLKKAEALGKANSALREAQARQAERKTAEANIAMAQRDEAMAQVDLYTHLIAQAEIIAPLDGEVLSGDLMEKRGARVNQGDKLFELAQRDSLRAELFVPERDIQDVSLHQEGELATTSLPSERHPLVIERIVPLGEAKEGDNIFRVYAHLPHVEPRWRPGLEGEARIDVGHRRLAWIWTHRVIEFVQLKAWSYGWTN